MSSSYVTTDVILLGARIYKAVLVQVNYAYKTGILNNTSISIVCSFSISIFIWSLVHYLYKIGRGCISCYLSLSWVKIFVLKGRHYRLPEIWDICAGILGKRFVVIASYVCSVRSDNKYQFSKSLLCHVTRPCWVLCKLVCTENTFQQRQSNKKLDILLDKNNHKC